MGVGNEAGVFFGGIITVRTDRPTRRHPLLRPKFVSILRQTLGQHFQIGRQLDVGCINGIGLELTLAMVVESAVDAVTKQAFRKPALAPALPRPQPAKPSPCILHRPDFALLFAIDYLDRNECNFMPRAREGDQQF